MAPGPPREPEPKGFDQYDEFLETRIPLELFGALR